MFKLTEEQVVAVDEYIDEKYGINGPEDPRPWQVIEAVTVLGILVPAQAPERADLRERIARIIDPEIFKRPRIQVYARDYQLAYERAETVLREIAVPAPVLSDEQRKEIVEAIDAVRPDDGKGIYREVPLDVKTFIALRRTLSAVPSSPAPSVSLIAEGRAMAKQRYRYGAEICGLVTRLTDALSAIPEPEESR